MHGATGIDDVIERVCADRPRVLDRLVEFIAIESVSADPTRADQVVRAAEWLTTEMRESGLTDARVVSTDGHPVVLGSWRGAGPDAPTVLVYCHYDVQPEDPVDEWRSPPFTATITGDRLVARGSADDKGPIMAHLSAVRAWLAARGGLPVNVVFCFEGEEESGSPNMVAFLERHRAELDADLVVVSDTSMLGVDVPAIVVGMRGLAYVEVTVDNTVHDVHSGKFGGGIANPAIVLSQMLAALHDEHGRITVPGFYERVREPTQAERAELAELTTGTFDEAAWLASTGAVAPAGESGWTTLERLWLRPTLDVAGLRAGYTGAGAKTIIPASATAKITCRLVADQDHTSVTRAIIAYLEQIAPPGVRVHSTPQHGGPPATTARDHPAVRAASLAYELGYGKHPVFIREGGSIPIVASFRNVLDRETLLLGFGLPDQNEHAPNEWLSLTNFGRATQTAAHFWSCVGDLGTDAFERSVT